MRTAFRVTMLVAGSLPGLVIMATPSLAQSTPLEAAAGANPQSRSVATYIDTICPSMVALNNVTPLQGAQADLLGRCRAVRGSARVDAAAAGNALGQITPDELLPQDAALRGAVQRQTAAVYGRLNALGRGPAAGSELTARVATTRLALQGDRDLPYAADTGARFQLFGTYSHSGGSQSTTLLEPGFDSRYNAGTIGADYRFSSGLTAGLAVGYGETRLAFSGNNGSLGTKTVSLSGYGLVELGQHVDVTLLAAWSHLNYRSIRPINYSVVFAGGTDTIAATALGNTTANQVELSAGITYTLAAGAWTFAPSAQAAYSSLSIAAFDETGAGGLNFSFPDQRVESLQFTLGGTASYAVSTGFGVLSPYVQGRAIFETLDHARTVGLRYVNDPIIAPGNFGARLTTTAGDRTRFLFGGGVSAQFASGLSAFAEASGLFGMANVSLYTVSIGIRAAL